MKKRMYHIDDECESMVHNMHWYFLNKSDVVRTAIRLLYLLHTKKEVIDWKKEKPII